MPVGQSLNRVRPSMASASWAIAEIFSLEDEALGTAFAVSRDKGLAAFHCLGDRTSARLRDHRVRLVFDDGVVIEAEVLKFDYQLDVALLQFDEQIPELYQPLRLVIHAARHARFVVVGWPLARPFSSDAFAVSGIITETRITIFDHIPAIQLYCEQAAVGMMLDGFSGSPILVETTRGEAVIGIVRCSPESRDRSGVADGGTVFATSSEAILRLWPELAACQVKAAPVGPADYGISYCTSPDDVSWGVWIAQVLDESSLAVFTRQWYLRPGDDYVEVLSAGFAPVRQIFVVVSEDYGLDRDALHLVEQKVISEHPYARRIPVMIDDAELPEYLQRIHPLKLHNDKADETKCKDLLLETLQPLGRPESIRPFPGQSTRAMQERKNWRNGIQSAGRDEPGNRRI
jgi:hypothetical protein